jgi:hypothetical protein
MEVKTEKAVAKAIGGEVQVNSGRFWFAKGDIKFEIDGIKYLVDLKQSKKGVFVDLKMWDKIEEEAIGERRIPSLLLYLGMKPNGEPKRRLLVTELEVDDDNTETRSEGVCRGHGEGTTKEG